MNDRRTLTERRLNNAVPEALQRRGARRQAEERRESLRHPVTFELDREGETVAGELGLGGASFGAAHPPPDDVCAVRTTLGGVRYYLPMRVRRTVETKLGYSVHLAFNELPVQTELAIARWLDDAVSTASH